jgi:hypothetical protein
VAMAAADRVAAMVTAMGTVMATDTAAAGNKRA